MYFELRFYRPNSNIVTMLRFFYFSSVIGIFSYIIIKLYILLLFFLD